jgi:hypothetical protein
MKYQGPHADLRKTSLLETTNHLYQAVLGRNPCHRPTPLTSTFSYQPAFIGTNSIWASLTSSYLIGELPIGTQVSIMQSGAHAAYNVPLHTQFAIYH